MMNIAAIHRNPLYWTKPDEFLPERFIQDSTAWNADLVLRQGKPHTYFFLPFSEGAINCMCSRLAKAEMLLVVATVVGKFDFELAPTADLRHHFTGATLRPSKVDVTIHPLPPSGA
ncbi:Aste57867_9897 [Aphanomyces stellatus]|uniref:Aste57867_9897 protein n=1 Tax=Aphanomyces stellatus TaxID=120398 RepID=A0A485KPG9_9STRA|nr:hypothetical protein As57867_009858 [Aphanomyces stellatus]VFT86776.1 Aste57867_9897 [Aphanomyces stellatus]